ncbi:MAG TPA: nucleotidyl transferase AbiEii/AbiGii toxin family protein, partial [Candidatus Omnitrophota bacterium]|nr:nucleotidyl transferase AbiEii/AbiGii toxin family protein [Candidatus Omnitrophota bacterium]
MGKIDEKTMNWQLNMLPRATKRALQFLSQQKWLKTSHWYLAGGTALALQVGHRQSVDLDFFTQDKEFSINELLKHFPEKIWTSDIVREGTIYGRLLGAKVSFIAYPFFYSQDESLRYGTINVLSARDIAVMKIIAISQRGKKRDFIDLYWYAKNRESLTDIVKRLPKQYPTVAHDYHHIWKSLMYFKDAEDDPMP